MSKKYLAPIFSLIILVIFSAKPVIAESNKIWLIKSKAEPVYTLWIDGTVTFGEPDVITETITLEPNQCLYTKRWFVRGNALYTPWARKPIVYKFESKKGNCRIGLAAKNFAGGGKGWTKPTGYSHFKVDVYVDNHKKGRLSIEASDTQINTDYLDIEQLDKGKHKIKFIWLNDKYNPGHKQDANIEIHNVVIEQSH